MKVLLANFSLTNINLEQAKTLVREHVFRAINAGVDVVIFPEVTLTGLINYGDPEQDFQHACALSDPFFTMLLTLSIHHQIYISIGVLEKDGQILYDTNIIFDPVNQTKVVYRRMSLGWKTANSPADIYREGDAPCMFNTQWGTFGVLLCGDLFDENIISQYQGIDYLIHPILCHNEGWFVNGKIITEDTFSHELEYYSAQVRKIHTTSFMVNHHGTDDYSCTAFSGA